MMELNCESSIAVLRRLLFHLMVKVDRATSAGGVDLYPTCTGCGHLDSLFVYLDPRIFGSRQLENTTTKRGSRT